MLSPDLYQDKMMVDEYLGDLVCRGRETKNMQKFPAIFFMILVFFNFFKIYIIF